MLVVLILNFHRVNYFTCNREAIHDFQVLEQRREGQLDNLQIWNCFKKASWSFLRTIIIREILYLCNLRTARTCKNSWKFVFKKQRRSKPYYHLLCGFRLTSFIGRVCGFCSCCWCCCFLFYLLPPAPHPT